MASDNEQYFKAIHKAHSKTDDHNRALDFNEDEYNAWLERFKHGPHTAD